MVELKASILDALYSEYGKYISLAERTSHSTRMAYHDKADGVLKAILVVEGFDLDAVYLRESVRDVSDIPESERKRIDADFSRAYQRAREIHNGTRSPLS